MKIKKLISVIFSVLFSIASLSATELEEALLQTAKQFSSSIKSGTTIAIVGISSPTKELSDFILDEITIGFIRERKLTVANRANLEAIKTEMNFQLSGEVSTDSIQQLGAMSGANVVIHGKFIPLGSKYSLTIQALNVSSAEVINICRYDIEENETLEVLLGSSHTKRKRKYTKWSNDLQIGIGTSSASIKFQYYDYFTDTRTTIEKTSMGFFMGATNYNLYNFNNVFSFGFAESLCGSVEGLYALDFILGPAIGINIKNIVKLQFSPGLDLGFWGASDTNPGVWNASSAHFSLDFCFKFLPNKIISPLFDLRIKCSDGRPDDDRYEYEKETFFVSPISCIFGMSFNFGKR